MKVLVLTSAYLRFKDDPKMKYDFVTQICERLAQKEIDVMVIGPRDGQEPLFEDINGVRIFRHYQSPGNLLKIAFGDGVLPNIQKNKILFLAIPFFIFFQFLKTLKLVIKEKPDLIHAHWLAPQGIVAVLASRILFWRKIPVVVTVHSADYWGLKRILGPTAYRFFTKPFVNSFKQIAAVSESLKRELGDFFQIKDVIRGPMGIDTNRFVYQTQSHKKFNLLSVGTLTEHKAPDTIIKALAHLKDENYKMSFAGEGAFKDDLQKLAHSLGVSGQTKFLGFKSHDFLPEVYSTHDVLIAASRQEGLGLMVLEAMSSGTLVVASSIEAFDDAVTDGVTGFRFQVEDSEGLASTIRKIYERSDLDKIRANARRRVDEFFSWDSVINNYLNIYHKALN